MKSEHETIIFFFSVFLSSSLLGELKKKKKKFTRVKTREGVMHLEASTYRRGKEEKKKSIIGG